MSVKSILVLTEVEIDTFFPEGRFEALKSLLGDCRVVDCRDMGAEEWRALLAEVNPKIIVAGWKMSRLPEDALREVCPHLKYVCYLAGSVRKVVPRSLIEDGLLVSNWGASISRTIAECALFLAISCCRNLAHWNRQMHDCGGWKDDTTTTRSLFEKRVGIHGYGSIARALIALLKPFNCELVVYSDGVPAEVFKADGVSSADSVEDLFRDRDVVFELEALIPERVKVVNESLLRSMTRGGIFVNVARGELVDEEALLRVVNDGHIKAGVDVYSVEPLPKDHPFRGCYDIVMLPHIAGPTTDRRRDAGDHAHDNVARFLNGEAVSSIVTTDIYDRST
ncbi:hydroxyacid dehydrogenase [Pelagicoccus mobilis]|uniref:Hydroxyacid dehydrogenase n=1 Tax=Pelagicoccus mobilis TaxID=415221 RepID=A0A934RTX6_9BACT|nr:hydroxyacid dehydrogenase [Pelagicoccus mobilis]MBK1875340.1 hydroxyacid dehydrogenase [Pelagicoccus mobilis]